MKNKTGFVIFMIVIFILAVIGMTTIAIFSHELVHKYQAKDIAKTSDVLCGLCVGSDFTGFYKYTTNTTVNNHKVLSEGFPYTLFFVLVGSFMVYFMWGIKRYTR